MLKWIKRWRQRKAAEKAELREALLPLLDEPHEDRWPAIETELRRRQKFWQRQQELFPEGKPSPEEAIARLAQAIREQNGMCDKQGKKPI